MDRPESDRIATPHAKWIGSVETVRHPCQDQNSHLVVMLGEAAVADGLEPAEGVGRLQAKGLRRVGVICPSCSPGRLNCTGTSLCKILPIF
jgi:hypothetical protein